MPFTPSASSPRSAARVPNFRLTRGDLSDISLADFEGKVKILNIVPTLGTGVGAASARRFEKQAGDLGNVVVLTISRYLPSRRSAVARPSTSPRS